MKQVEDLLAKHGLSQDVIFAQAFSTHLNDLDRLERMIASAETRRTHVLREIERRRSSFGARLRGASDQIIAGEVVDASSSRSKVDHR